MGCSCRKNKKNNCKLYQSSYTGLLNKSSYLINIDQNNQDYKEALETVNKWKSNSVCPNSTEFNVLKKYIEDEYTKHKV